MSVDEKKVFGPVILLLVFTAIFGFWPQREALEPDIPIVRVPPLVDSLYQIYDKVKIASIRNNETVVRKLIDTAELSKLQKVAAKFGHDNIGSYLASRIRNWPNLDTLKFLQIHLGENYARLSYSHDLRALGENQERMMYTFILFHLQSKQWRYVTMTMIEKERFDLYGYERDVHETDLPPVLRFPRII